MAALHVETVTAAPARIAPRLLACIPNSRLIDDALAGIGKAIGAESLGLTWYPSDLYLSGYLIHLDAVFADGREAVRASGGTVESAVKAFASVFDERAA